jgi:hypothetical protein
VSDDGHCESCGARLESESPFNYGLGRPQFSVEPAPESELGIIRAAFPDSVSIDFSIDMSSKEWISNVPRSTQPFHIRAEFSDGTVVDVRGRSLASAIKKLKQERSRK